jgi:hypothetical protein
VKEGYDKLVRSIFQLQHGDELGFNELSLKLFKVHQKRNPVYREFVLHLNVDPKSVNHVSKIPFLPIQLFKHHRVSLFKDGEDLVFESSGTTGQIPSKHFVADENVYERSSLSGFRKAYGNPSDYCILALLPSYLDRSNSSLVHMAKLLIRESGHRDGGFYLDRLTSLSKLLKKNTAAGQKTLLLGVTFGLLDLAEKHPQQLENCIIMETGGMKGRRREMPREEVHGILKNAFEVDQIHSEYGMTELLSQAYSDGDGIFSTPPWMKIQLRDMTDPLSQSERNSGAVNIIDLANVLSCPFIATSDLGEMVGKHRFKILGRTDQSDIRGCNLMLA